MSERIIKTRPTVDSILETSVNRKKALRRTRHSIEIAAHDMLPMQINPGMFIILMFRFYIKEGRSPRIGDWTSDFANMRFQKELTCSA